MHKILFVHSNSKLVALYQPHLSLYFAFDSAGDGLTAIRKARLIKPSLIITDDDLPLLSGLGLLKFVRSENNLRHIPVLFFTDSQDAAALLSMGANDLVSRKSSPEDLVEKVYHHIRINQPILNLN